MGRYAIPLMLMAGVVVVAAPVPQPPVEDLRVFKSREEFDTETIGRTSKVVGWVEKDKGLRTITDKGWYAVYIMEDGVMTLSTIPDGRLRYGYFAHYTGVPIRYNDRLAPDACVGCHNKTKEK